MVNGNLVILVFCVRLGPTDAYPHGYVSLEGRLQGNGLCLNQQLVFQAHYKGWDELDLTAVMKIYEEMAGIGRKSLFCSRYSQGLDLERRGR
jgi:hypothetical protein